MPDRESWGRGDDRYGRGEDRGGYGGQGGFGPGLQGDDYRMNYGEYGGPYDGGRRGFAYGASGGHQGQGRMGWAGDYYRGDVDRHRQGGYGGWGREGAHGEERGWWDRTSDEVSSWFGDHGAERRRRIDELRAGHRGRGPRGYRRSDDRIHEDIGDRLTDDPYLDASDVEVTVKDREVTLSGTVDSRAAKRRAEDIADNVSGVANVQNNLRVREMTAATPTAAARTTGRENLT